MQSQVDQISQVLVEVSVEVPWERVEKGLDDAYRTLQRQAHVRGFRKGKVPRHVVKNLMGKRVREDVASRLAEEGILAAIEEHSLDLVAVPERAEPSIAEGKPMSFKVKLEVRPKIDEVKTDSITVERVLDQVTDEQVNEEIEKLREQSADLVEPDPPRPAAEGDVLMIDISVAVEGEERPEMNATDSRAQLGEGALLPEIEEGLVGMSVGEEKTVELTFGEDHPRDELKGKPAALTLKVKEHREKQLPELDDEFAKDLEHESLDALRQVTRQRLEEAAARRSESLLKEAVVDAMVDANPIEVPPSMVQRQQQAMLRELFQLQQMLGQALPYDENTHEQMRTRAERKVRAGILFGEIARSQSLDVTDQEVDARMAEIAEQTGKHIAKVRAEHQGDSLEELKAGLLEKKLLEYLMAQATITEPGDAKAEKAKAKEPGDETKPAKKKATKKKATKKKAEGAGDATADAKPAAKKKAGSTKKKAATKKAKEADK